MSSRAGDLTCGFFTITPTKFTKLIPELLGYLSQHEEISPDTLATWLARHLGSEHEVWNVSQAIQLLTEVERLCPQLVQSPPAGLLQPIDIKAALATLTHE